MLIESVRGGKEPVLIYGPCAVENKLQMRVSTQAVVDAGGHGLRGCLTKPRTVPGFDGIGLRGAALLGEASQRGLIVATEVKNERQVHSYTRRILSVNPEANIAYWIGVRTTPLDDACKRIARAVSRYDGKQVALGVKNPVHRDLKSWIGAVDHIRSVGVADDRLFLIHRGFHPSYHPNKDGLRNIPDWDLALEAARITGLPLFEDPSHQGGPWKGDSESVSYSLGQENTHPVIRVLDRHLEQYAFDGYMIEAHPAPFEALSDVGQQLSLDVLPEISDMIRSRWSKTRGQSGSLIINSGLKVDVGGTRSLQVAAD